MQQQTQNFHNLALDIKRKRSQRRDPLVVLDFFSGIGTTALILKRLHVAVKTIIIVEQDRIAKHVARFNHNNHYNEKLQRDDGITYVVYDEFEAFEKDAFLDVIIKDHGEIDLIVGHQKGGDEEGDKNEYLVKIGEIIKKIQQRQTKTALFLTENDCFKTDLQKISEDVYGIPPYLIDAQEISPCRRPRLYWTNIPKEGQNVVPNKAQALLENECVLPAVALEGTRSNGTVKANTFLTSTSHQHEDFTMSIEEVPQNENETLKFRRKTLTVADQERMLGLPVGYVSEAMDFLHNSLREDGFSVEFHEDDRHWYDSLDPKLHWTMYLQFEFINHPETFYAIKILHKESGAFLTSEENSNHLLGNTWSVPVLETLLSPLKQICSRRKYPGSDYPFEFDFPDSTGTKTSKGMKREF